MSKMPNLSDIPEPGVFEDGWYFATITDVDVDKIWPSGGSFINIDFELDGVGESARGAYNTEDEEGVRDMAGLKRLKALSIFVGLGNDGEYDPDDLLEKKIGIRVAKNNKGYITAWEEASTEDQRPWLNEGKAAVDSDVPF